jgi:hypothetical protein
VANFFGGDPANRGGARVGVTTAAGSAVLLVGSGTGGGDRVTGYPAGGLGTGAAGFDLDAAPGFAGGVFVG